MILNSSGSSTFDANGIARVTLGPQRYGIDWRVKRVVTTCGGTLEPSLYVYRNSIIPTALVDTIKGYNTASETDIYLPTLDSLVFAWEGGSVGVYATAIVTGEIVDARTGQRLGGYDNSFIRRMGDSDAPVILTTMPPTWSKR